jgi:hypothetical protein
MCVTKCGNCSNYNVVTLQIWRNCITHKMIKAAKHVPGKTSVELSKFKVLKSKAFNSFIYQNLTLKLQNKQTKASNPTQSN